MGWVALILLALFVGVVWMLLFVSGWVALIVLALLVAVLWIVLFGSVWTGELAQDRELALLRDARDRRNAFLQGVSWEVANHRRLLLRVRGDMEKAEWLINRERAENPEGDRRQWIRRALDRPSPQ